MSDTPTAWSTIALASPEMYLVAAICAVLLIDVFAGGAKRPRLTSTVTLLALAVGAWVTLDHGNVSVRVLAFDGFYRVAGVPSSLGGVEVSSLTASCLLLSRGHPENADGRLGCAILRGAAALGHAECRDLVDNIQP